MGQTGLVHSRRRIPAPSAPLSTVMTIPALYGACLPSLLPQPQMTPFTLAMISVLHIQAAGLRSLTVAGLALCHRLAFLPDVAPALEVVMALGAGHTPGFVHPVAEFHRRLTAGPRHGDLQETIRRGLGKRAAMSSQDTRRQDQPRHQS